MANVTIQDNGEPLVSISEYVPNTTIRLHGGGTAHVRKTVADMLHKATQYLPGGVNFLITNAWRSRQHQEKILKYFTDRFSREHPEWSKERVAEEVYKYAAPNSGIDASGHLCGAALDIRLVKDGKLLPMVSKKLSFQENSLSLQPKLPKHLQKNRQILREALEKAGFSNLDEEYWHFSYGDYEWAKKNGKKEAFYGVVER